VNSGAHRILSRGILIQKKTNFKMRFVAALPSLKFCGRVNYQKKSYSIVCTPYGVNSEASFKSPLQTFIPFGFDFVLSKSHAFENRFFMPMPFRSQFQALLEDLNSTNYQELINNGVFLSPHEKSLAPNELAIHRAIDHTLLDPKATSRDIKRLGQETLQYQFKVACVAPQFVPILSDLLKNSDSLVCTVLNFPLGQSSLQAVLKEAELSVRLGASELDLVLPIGLFLGQDYQGSFDLIYAVCALGCDVKVIIETAYLTDLQVLIAGKLAESAGARFVKTSTGFALQEPKGAQLKHVQMLRYFLKPSTLIKASGGIRTRTKAIEFLSCGADRLGTSSGIDILNPMASKSQESSY